MRRFASVRAISRRARAENGFTLVELLVTMAILLTVVTALTGALVSASHNEADENNRFQAQTQARQALTKLEREIHCASQIQAISPTDLTGTTGVALSSTPSWGIIVTLPDGCPTGGASAVTAKWCTQPSGSTWNLYRSSVAGDGTSLGCPGTNGVLWATALTDVDPFSLPTAETSGNHYTLVHIDLQVNPKGAGMSGAYNLVDDVAALNSCRWDETLGACAT